MHDPQAFSPQGPVRNVASVVRPNTPASMDASGSSRRSGPRFGHYRALGLIGVGAMGYVYEAEHVLLGGRVAVKTLRPELIGDETLASRLLVEARATNLVGSAHVVEVTDIALEQTGRVWFVMELLDGRSLASVCDEGPVSLLRALRIAGQICNALTAVHEAGIVHRDVKPENIFLVERDGLEFVKLFDFGIAKLPEGEAVAGADQALGPVIGTPPYLPPEQASAGEHDHRSDLYSVGALLFELITGRMVFERPTTSELLAAARVARPPVPSQYACIPETVRAEVDSLVRSCLAKQPSERPASARVLAGTLRRIALRLDPASPGSAMQTCA